MPISPAAPPATGETFCNAIAEGADPWVVRHEGKYYWTFTAAGRGVYLFCSDRLTSLGERHLVWRAPAAGAHSREVWAPELHRLDGQWYIYTTASDGKNATHRVIVLESETGTPRGPYRFKSELYTGDDCNLPGSSRWAIDATILEHAGRRYVIWSGWADDTEAQWLYIAPLANPWTVIGNRVRLCANDDFLWEHVGGVGSGMGLNEAPQILQRSDRTFIVFSAGGSWEPDYKLALLEFVGEDPLQPGHWRKHPQPVFTGTEATWGAGHACFTLSPDGAEDWMVYHAKESRERDWKRSVFIQPFAFVDGVPAFGRPVARGVPIALPSGQKQTLRWVKSYVSNFDSGWSEWDYYGHQDLISIQDGRLFLGEYQEYLALFRSGEKLLLRDQGWLECTILATVRLEDERARIGVLLCVRAPHLGFDRQEGVFVGIERDAVIVCRWHNGRRTEILRQPEPVRAEVDYELEIDVRRSGISMRSPWQFHLTDAGASAAEGMIGILLEHGKGVVQRFQVNAHESAAL